MPQFVYDAHYVDTIGVIRSAKECGLDMVEVQRRLDEAGFDQEKMWAWQKWVYSKCVKAVPTFIDWMSRRERLNILEAMTPALQKELHEAMNPSPIHPKLKKWAKKADKAILAGCKAMRAKLA